MAKIDHLTDANIQKLDDFAMYEGTTLGEYVLALRSLYAYRYMLKDELLEALLNELADVLDMIDRDFTRTVTERPVVQRIIEYIQNEE